MRDLGGRFYRILHPKLTFLLMSKYEDKINVMALAWHMPVDTEERLIAIAMDHENYSYELIKKSGEFTLNVLSIDNLYKIWKAGTISGRELDKIKELQLEMENGIKINTPHIKNALAFLECKVEKEIEFTDHSLFIAKVLFVWADEKYFKDTWMENVKIPLHVGKNLFTIVGKFIHVK